MQAYRNAISTTGGIPQQPNLIQNPKYVPLRHGLDEACIRVRDALISLSVAEIRTSISTTEMVDTVGEVTLSVDQSLNLHQLFVSDLKASEKNKQEANIHIQTLLQKRYDVRSQNDASKYKEINGQLMEATRLARAYAPPTVNASSIMVASPKILEVLETRPNTNDDAVMIKKRYKMKQKGGF